MYQPRIKDENIRRLFYLKCKEKKPMTVLVNRIIEEFFRASGKEGKEDQG